MIAQACDLCSRAQRRAVRITEVNVGVISPWAAPLMPYDSASIMMELFSRENDHSATAYEGASSNRLAEQPEPELPAALAMATISRTARLCRPSAREKKKKW